MAAGVSPVTANARYVGRFAPSPTGPLHFGSLVAAAASYLQARQADGRWLLRVEDIDPPREQPGATDRILSALERYGFEWDGPVIYQSHNRERHLAVIDELRERGLAYPCGCSRKDLADAARGTLGTIYPGTCRAGCDSREFAVRVRTHDDPVSFTDRLQGPQTQRLESESGDFVILRRDGLVAYNLAVVIDDIDEGVTEVLRGIDLLDSTPRHIHLQQLVGAPVPDYAHIPVVENAEGQKLSKLTGARAIPMDAPQATLLAALRALGMTPPAELESAQIDTVWAWARANWDLSALARQRRIVGHSDPLA